MKFQNLRRPFHEIHLWLGIISGFILFVVCLSGTVLVFQTEIRRIAEPARYFVDVPAGKAALSADELIAKIETAKQEQGLKVTSITIPEQPNRTISMSLTAPRQGGTRPGGGGGRSGGARSGGGAGGEDRGGRGGAAGSLTAPGTAPGQGGARPGGGGGGRGNTIYANPYTGEIVGEGPNVVDPFFMSVMRLHRFFWLPMQYGKPLVGIATIIFIVVCLWGLILWLPKTWSSFSKWRAWKTGLRIRCRRGTWPLIYDLHNTIGFYILIPSLILALTGLCWSFAWYRDAASSILGERVFSQRNWSPAAIDPVEESAKPLSVGEIIALQNQLTPGPGEISVSIPQDNESAMAIRKGRDGFFSSAFRDRTQWDRFRGTTVSVEQYGKIIEIERFADKPLGAKLSLSIRNLHFGDITGLSSKIFFFAVCLFATTLPLTGTAFWIKQLRAKYVRRKEKVTSQLFGRQFAKQQSLRE